MRTPSAGPRRRRRRAAAHAPPASALLGLTLLAAAFFRSVRGQCVERPACLDDGIPRNCPPQGQSCPDTGPLAVPAAGGGWVVNWDLCYRNPSGCARSEPLPVAPGDIITFNWVNGQTAREHNVVLVGSDAAFNSCNKAGFVFSSSPASYTVPSSASPGSGIYFVCGIGSHCEGGMKLPFAVVAGPPSEPASFECYRWRLKREQRRGFLAETLPASTVGRNPTAAECGAAAAAAGFPSYGLVRRTRRKAVCVAGEVPEGYVFGLTGSFGSTTGCDAEGTLGSRNVVTVYGSQ